MINIYLLAVIGDKMLVYTLIILCICYISSPIYNSGSYVRRQIELFAEKINVHLKLDNIT